MSTVSTARCSKQNLSNINFGEKRKAKPIATGSDIAMINKAIVALNQAKSETTETGFKVKLTDGFRLTRSVIRSWNDL